MSGDVKVSLKTCAFFDFVDFDDDKENFETVIKSLNQEFAEPPIDNILVTSYVNEFEKAASRCDICFIDFGGLDCGGKSGLLESTVRQFEKLIEENENKFFVFILTMPLEFYLDEEILKRPNVIKSRMYDLRDDIKQLLKKFGL